MNKKIILVTGATSKLGYPIVEALAEKKWIVYAGMRDTKKSIWKNSKNIIPIKLDITSDIQCKSAISKIIKAQKRLDVLINNAGVSLAGPTLEFTSDLFLEILNVNTLGAFRVSKYAAIFMRKQKFRGQIINITSLNGLVSLPNFGVYGASKFALEALTSSLRVELKKDNIWVTAIAPGAIKTSVKLSEHDMPHKPIREKFKILQHLLKMATQDEVVKKIINTIESESPPAKIVVGRDAIVSSALNRYLPNVIWDNIILFMWKK